MKNSVLITSVSRKVSLVQAFQKSGWSVTGQDINKNAVALKFCGNTIIGDHFDFNYDLIVPTRDAELLEFREGVDMLGCPGLLLAPSAETLGTCIDKLKFHDFCKKNGFRTPEVYFVKPRISNSGKEVECVWQENINAKEEYSVDLFAYPAGNVINAVPRKRLKTISGESCVTTTVEHESILNGSITLAKSLKLFGHNVLQCFFDGEPIWTDVNCRFGGASVVGIDAGCTSPRYLLQIVNGEAIKPQIGHYKRGLTGYSYPEWIIQE